MWGQGIPVDFPGGKHDPNYLHDPCHREFSTTKAHDFDGVQMCMSQDSVPEMIPNEDPPNHI